MTNSPKDTDERASETPFVNGEIMWEKESTLDPIQQFESPFLKEGNFSELRINERELEPEVAFEDLSEFDEEIDEKEYIELDRKSELEFEPGVKWEDLNEWDEEEFEAQDELVVDSSENTLEQLLPESFVPVLSIQEKEDLVRLLKDAQDEFNLPGLTSTKLRYIVSKINKHQKNVLIHLRNTNNLFSSTTRIKRDEIDWSLVLIIAAREMGITTSALRRTYSSASNKLVNSAGRDTHSEGKGGFDNLFKFRHLFPRKVKTNLKSVRKDKCKNKENPHDDEGFVEGRENTCPALIPEKYLLVGAIVNITGSEKRFEILVNKILDNPEDLLSSLNKDARRIWVALTFARPGGKSDTSAKKWGVITILNDYKLKLDGGKITDLNAILDDEALRKRRPFVMKAVKASAHAWMLDRFLPTSARKVLYKAYKLPADYSCVRPSLSHHELIESETESCQTLPISNNPQPCRFYTIKRGIDAKGLIDLAGRSYDVDSSREKLKLSQWINNHSYNQRFWKSNNASKNFPKGRISFNPRFSSDISKQANATSLSPRGHTFATIFIPPPPSWLKKTFLLCQNLPNENEVSFGDELEPELWWEDYDEFGAETFEDGTDEDTFAEIWTNENDETEPELVGESLSKFDKGEFEKEAELEDIAELGTEEEELEPELLDELSKEEIYELEFSEDFLDDEQDEESLNDEIEDDTLVEQWNDENVESELFSEFDTIDDQILQHELRLSDQPKPNMFYRIKKGDTLLKIAGKAYQVGAGARRLSFAKYINGHPLNHRYYVQGKNTFTKKHFLDGIISFLPKFACDVDKILSVRVKPPKGNCFAVIWIPNNRSSYHPYLGKGQKKTILEPKIEEEFEKSQIEFRKRISGNSIKKIPYRWICALELSYKDPDNEQELIQFLGTGFLIDHNYILTAAHNLFNVVKGSKGTPKPMQVSSIRVSPGVNGVQGKDFLFGAYEIKKTTGNIAVPSFWRSRNKHFRTLPLTPNQIRNFHNAGDKETNRFDYGLIKLDKNIGDQKFRKINNKPLGYWGYDEFSQIKPINPKSSINTHINICGYDVVRGDLGRGSWRGSGSKRFQEFRGFKGYFQFKATTRIDEIDIGSRSLINYSEVDTHSGMSGGPVWIEHWPKTMKRSVRQPKLQLVGVHGHHGYGLLLTSEVLKDIEKLKIQLG